MTHVHVHSAYTCPAWRFEQRFASFRSIPNPPVLTYEDFERTISRGKEGVKEIRGAYLDAGKGVCVYACVGECVCVYVCV